MLQSLRCNLEQLKLVATKLASCLQMTDVICLEGDLGSGKTSFARYLIQQIVKDEIEVNSPTFNIVHVYDGHTQIWHFDLYRLKKFDEVYELGIEDALSYGITIIEWPQIINKLLPDSVITIKIEFTNKSNIRKLTMKNFNFFEVRCPVRY